MLDIGKLGRGTVRGAVSIGDGSLLKLKEASSLDVENVARIDPKVVPNDR
jgi:hypothetical protein